MSISVIQRSSEIGIRRAVGHSRSKIGLQFLLESLFVGVLGGILGAALGVGVVYLVSSFADWVVVIDYSRIPIWMSLALVVSVVAGPVPVDQGRAPRAARDASTRLTRTSSRRSVALEHRVVAEVGEEARGIAAEREATAAADRHRHRADLHRRDPMHDATEVGRGP